LEFFLQKYPLSGRKNLEQEISLKISNGRTREQAIIQLFIEFTPNMVNEILKNFMTVRIITDAEDHKVTRNFLVKESNISHEEEDSWVKKAYSLPTCSAYPYCELIADRNNCLCVQASGLNCNKCSYYVSFVPGNFNKIIVERDRRHHEFVISNRWKKEVRSQILKYDKYTCIICGKRSNQLANPYRIGLNVHHIIHKSADEDLSPRNLVTLCSECHDMLHGFVPYGMWLHNWPDISKVKLSIKEFYDRVREVTEKNQERFKTPLENVMGYALLCLICQKLSDCEWGKKASFEIFISMVGWQTVTTKIVNLKDKMTHEVAEGHIIKIDRERVVDTKNRNERLSYATLEDESGRIRLNLWGEQIDSIREGDIVRICNCYIITYENILNVNAPRGRSKIIINPSSFPLLILGEELMKEAVLENRILSLEIKKVGEFERKVQNIFAHS